MSAIAGGYEDLDRFGDKISDYLVKRDIHRADFPDMDCAVSLGASVSVRTLRP